MTAIIIGLALAFNILVIIWKLKHRSKTDAFLDALLLGVVMFIAGDTLTGMMVGTIASFTVSTYLLIYPTEPISFSLPRVRLPSLPHIRFNWKFKRPHVHVSWS